MGANPDFNISWLFSPLCYASQVWILNLFQFDSFFLSFKTPFFVEWSFGSRPAFDWKWRHRPWSSAFSCDKGIFLKKIDVDFFWYSFKIHSICRVPTFALSNSWSSAAQIQIVLLTMANHLFIMLCGATIWNWLRLWSTERMLIKDCRITMEAQFCTLFAPRWEECKLILIWFINWLTLYFFF